MRRLAFSFVLAAGLVVAGGAVAAPASPPKPVKDPDRIVCEKQRVLGSRRPKMVCMTVAEWQLTRDTAQRTLLEGRRTLGSANAVLGSGASGPY